jgi:hypothetical protein
MDHSSAQKIINDIETSVAVDKITYGSHPVWPLIKYYLYFSYVKKSWKSNRANDPMQTKAPNYKPTLLNRISSHLNNSIQLVKNYSKHRYELRKYYASVKEQDALMIDVRDVLYEEKISNKYYSRYLSPYLEALLKKHKVNLLSIEERTAIHEQKSIVPYIFNTRFYLAYTSILKHYTTKYNSEITFNNFELFAGYFKDKTFHNNSITEAFLKPKLEQILQFEKLWRTLLKVRKPKVVFLSCHYGSLSHLGMLMAAKHLNIRTVEIQHGISLGTMYMGWSKEPKGGYDLLPEYYWSWSLADIDALKFSRKNSKSFKPILGGNLWFEKNMQESLANDANIQVEELIHTASPLKIILVTLQHSLPLSQTLIDSIQYSSKDWLWLIRFHPRDFVDPTYRSNYIKALSGFTNIEYEFTTKANLYSLLKKVNVHITHFSTVAIESISFKVPTILLDDKMKDTFKMYIDSKNFFIANTSTELLDYINSNICINEKTFDYYKLHTNKETLTEIDEMF